MLVLFTRAFWTRIGWGLARAALAALVPFIPALVDDPAGAWRPALTTVVLLLVTMVATSLRGLPDGSGAWWAVALQRAVRQFGQFVAAGLVTAVALSDVDWPTLLHGAVASALATFILAALTLLPGTDLQPSPVVDGVAQITTLTDTERTALRQLQVVLDDSAGMAGSTDPAVGALDKILRT